MALKNPDIYPQWSVHVWTEHQKPDGEWEHDCTCVYSFDNELEAYALYKSISIGGNVLEVDLQKDNEDDCFPVRHKDTKDGYSEYIY